MLREYLKSIADAIRYCYGTSTAIKINAQNFPNEIKSLHYSSWENGRQYGIEEGIEAGKQAEWNEFWDTFQQNGNKTGYDRAFYSVSRTNSGWTDKNYNPKYDFTISSGSQMFWAAQMTNTKKAIIVKNGADISYMFGSSLIKTIPLLSFEGNVLNFSNTFIDCGNLKDITIEGTIFKDISFSASSLLTRESIISIINALSTETTGTTLSLNKTAVTTAFGTDFENSTEWTNLTEPKSNWTISVI